jgi:hypothetical protein
VIRLKRGDAFEVINLDPSDWIFNLPEADIAIAYLGLARRGSSSNALVPHMFAREKYNDIGVGEDVFMLGLFVDQAGHEKNAPLARFGNVSMLASKAALVTMGTRSYESYIVDMRSRNGYSGAPVFVFRTFGNDLGTHQESLELDLGTIDPDQYRSGRRLQVTAQMRMRPMLQLLGIHYAQFLEPVRLDGLLRLDDAAEDGRLVVTDETSVMGQSGMTCVAPAWKILELLEIPALEAQRNAFHGP